ncbi:MAG: dienelactone hydrolase family protein [Noviherbaspirillum sp.]
MGLSMSCERVSIQADDVRMDGALWLPDAYIGVILFATEIGGSGGARAPNDYVASVLRDAHLGILRLDLPAEMTSKQAAGIDVGALARWLDAACDWLRQQGATAELPIGLFCTGKGAAAALQVAAGRGKDIAMIVIRGGRPDLAGNGALGKINVPTLLIAGGLDEGVIDMNRTAYAALRCKKRFEIIPGAAHNFDEPCSPEVVARLARGWFLQHAYATYL